MDHVKLERFDREFERLCRKLGVDAAYYVPAWNADKSAIVTGYCGGEAGACEALDVLLRLGADAMREQEGGDRG